MERIITLLNEKNHYLEKFFSVNEHELLNFGDGCFDNVETFYNARDKILDLIHCIDELIEEENKKYGTEVVVTAAQRQRVNEILKRKDELVTGILAQDLQTLSYIEKEKSNIIRELRMVKQGKKVLHAYHSGAFQNQLDEEA